jgi:hypothetical protein
VSTNSTTSALSLDNLPGSTSPKGGPISLSQIRVPVAALVRFLELTEPVFP